MNDSNYQSKYRRNTGRSRRLYDKSTNIFPGGISHNIRYFQPYPFFVNKSKGKTLYDVDGNKYTDYWMGHWALILGHASRPITDALSAQVRKGTLYGTVNDASVELGTLIQKIMPLAELLRFSSTGSEATMYAVRLARARTGRRVIAKIIGGWHGFNTPLLQTVNYPFEYDEGPGLIQDEEQFVESIPFNDLDRSIKVLESIKDDLAGIIVEPVLGGAGCIPPEEGYLKGLQEFARKNASVFILDEIVTGFRLSLGGAIDYYKLDPDLFTLGKIVGGGMPIGVLCGKREVMSQADPVKRNSKQSCCAIGGGTFSANPMTMTAGIASLTYLMKNKDSVYSKINKLGNQTREGLTKIFSEARVPVDITGVGSIFCTHFLNNKLDRIHDATDVGMSDRNMLRRYQFALMSNHGIFFLPLKMGAFSEAHDERDVKALFDSTCSLLSSGRILASK
jgi:glutamate-1-semialdehyde 2,1-aminomutase